MARKGRFDAEHARELGIPLKFWTRLQHGETVAADEITYTPDMVMGAPRKGLKVTYCTDTRPTDGIVKHARGADLFICEGMYGEEDKIGKARENKHMTFREAATLAAEAEVAELWLTHYSPSLVRAEDFMNDVRRIFPRASAGRDGMSVELEFKED